MREPLPHWVTEAMLRLEQNGEEAWLVGGCVRDRLLGRPVHDYDLTVSCLPDRTAWLFRDHRLVEDGLLETDSAAVTLGGGGDVGGGMDPACAEEIRGRLAEAGLLLLEEPDYRRNLELRQQLYQQEGPIDCFVAVGGNVTSMGRGESGISLGQGLLSPEKIVRLTEDSGLVQRYLSQGLPVINLLNIKQLAADYGLPYDPAQWPERGTSAVYFETDYPGAVLLLGLAGAAVLLALCRWVRRSAGTARKEERGYHGQTESSADHPDH